MGKLRVMVEEEQELYRIGYEEILSREPSLELVKSTDEGHILRGDHEAIDALLQSAAPDVILIGAKTINDQLNSGLAFLCENYPQVNFVLIATQFRGDAARALRSIAGHRKPGAYLLKESVDTGEYLVRVITDVAEGRVILDPHLLTTWMGAGDISDSGIAEMTPRELDVLSRISMGYTNAAIARSFHVEIKTVERYINSIYSKLTEDYDELGAKDRRVEAALTYLKSTGRYSACS